MAPPTRKRTGKLVGILATAVVMVIVFAAMAGAWYAGFAALGLWLGGLALTAGSAWWLVAVVVGFGHGLSWLEGRLAQTPQPSDGDETITDRIRRPGDPGFIGGAPLEFKTFRDGEQITELVPVTAEYVGEPPPVRPPLTKTPQGARR
jgi:hypothetical protein